MVKTKDIVIIASILVVIASGFLGGNVGTVFLLLAIGIQLVLIYINPELSVLVLMIWAFNFYGTISYIKFGGSNLAISDLPILIFLVLLLKVIVLRKKIVFDKISKALLLFFVIAFAGTFSAYMIYGQSIFVGLYVLRSHFAYLIYFPFITLYRTGVIKKEKTISYLILGIKLMAIITLFEYLFLCFTGVNITSYVMRVRWGIRLFIAPLLQIIGCFFTVWDLCHSKSKKSNWIWLGIFVFEIVFIGQSRVTILGLIITILFEILFIKKVQRKWLILAVVGCMLLVAINIESVQNVIISSVIESSSDTTGNMFVRNREQAYFENLLNGHEIFGVGMPASSESYDSSAIYAGKIYDYFISDLGYFGLLYYYGYIGLIAYYVINIVGCVKVFKRRSQKEYMISFCWLFFNLIVSMTLLYFLARPALFTVMYIYMGVSLLEQEHGDRRGA